MFYANLQRLCSENNTTVTALLKDLNLSTSKGTAWKNGSIPKMDIIEKISDYFNVPTSYFFATDEELEKERHNDEVDEYLNILHKRGDIRMLFSVAKDATKEDIEIAADIIEKLVKKHRGDVD